MRYRHGVLLGLLLLAVITYLDRVCITFASARMQHDLGLDPRQWGFVLGAFTVSYAAFAIPGGTLGDRVGGRRILARFVVWWSTFTASTGLSRSYLSLLSIRFLFGAGEAGAFPNMSSVISRWFPQRERARAIGLTWMASRVGGAIAPWIVIPLQQQFGWRVAFLFLGGIGLAWAAGWSACYRDHPRLVNGISAKELNEIGDTPAVAKSHRLPWKQAIRSKNFILILLMYHTYCWGSFFYISWMPNFLQKGRGFSEDDLKIWGMLPFVLSGTATVLGGILSDKLVPVIQIKWARRSIGAGGLLLGGLFMAAAAAVAGNRLAAIFLAVGYGCMDAMLPVSWAVCMDVGGPHAGALSAAMNTSGQIASFLSSVAFGFAVEALSRHFSPQLSYSIPVYPLAAMLLISGLLFLQIDASQPLAGLTASLPSPDLEPLSVS